MVQKRSKSERRNVPKKKRNVKKVTITLPTDGLPCLDKQPSLLGRLVSAWKEEVSAPTRRVSTRTVASIIKQSNNNIEKVTLVRSTHHVPEQKEDLIFSVEYKQEK